MSRRPWLRRLCESRADSLLPKHDERCDWWVLQVVHGVEVDGDFGSCLSLFRCVVDYFRERARSWVNICRVLHILLGVIGWIMRRVLLRWWDRMVGRSRLRQTRWYLRLSSYIVARVVSGCGETSIVLAGLGSGGLVVVWMRHLRQSSAHVCLLSHVHTSGPGRVSRPSSALSLRQQQRDCMNEWLATHHTSRNSETYRTPTSKARVLSGLSGPEARLPKAR